MKLLFSAPSHPFARYEIGKNPLKPIDIRTDLKVLVALGWVKELTISHQKINLEDILMTELENFSEALDIVSNFWYLDLAFLGIPPLP